MFSCPVISLLLDISLQGSSVWKLMSSLHEWSWSIINGSPSISVITRLSFNFRFLVSTSAATWRSKDSSFLYSSLWTHLPLLIPFCFSTFCPFSFLNSFLHLIPKFPFLHSSKFFYCFAILSFYFLSFSAFRSCLTSFPLVFLLSSTVFLFHVSFSFLPFCLPLLPHFLSSSFFFPFPYNLFFPFCMSHFLFFPSSTHTVTSFLSFLSSVSLPLLFSTHFTSPFYFHLFHHFLLSSHVSLPFCFFNFLSHSHISLSFFLPHLTSFLFCLPNVSLLFISSPISLPFLTIFYFSSISSSHTSLSFPFLTFFCSFYYYLPHFTSFPFPVLLFFLFAFPFLRSHFF